MRITSTAADAGAPPAADRPDADEPGAAFEALLTSIAMKPIAESLGPLGAFFGDALARAALVRSPETEP